MPTTPAPGSRWPDRPLPRLIQGGMGVAVSSWRLAAEVARAGQLGVVSGTALDLVMVRRLQDGDPGRAVRRALADFPFRGVAAGILDAYLAIDGREPGEPYGKAPKASLQSGADAQRLAVAAGFVEVHLAKAGHDGLVGINLLEKIQLSTPAILYGAMLAGVDVVLMGAGIPREIPRLLDELAADHRGELPVDVLGAPEGAHRVVLDAVELFDGTPPAIRRPAFVAIVSADILATHLAKDERTRPDGFVVEGPTAGGHNAPARGRPVLDELGQPVFGPRDEANLERVAANGLPFWLAGGYGTPEGLGRALGLGATGVQVGTAFALAAESGFTPALRAQALEQLRAGTLEVRTDPHVSPTGFPFKVAQLPGTLSDKALAEARVRPPCDLGYLRRPYVRSSGTVGYQCPAEPVDVYVRKGGTVEGAAGRGCLCNSLMAAVGLGQTRGDDVELPLVTLGTDLDGVRRLLASHPEGWTARDVVDWVVAPAPAAAG